MMQPWPGNSAWRSGTGRWASRTNRLLRAEKAPGMTGGFSFGAPLLADRREALGHRHVVAQRAALAVGGAAAVAVRLVGGHAGLHGAADERARAVDGLR